jgi:hypothetical protein
MALRVVLIAARNCTRSEFLQAFSLGNDESVKEDGGYLWHLTSAWSVDWSRIDQGAGIIGGPTLAMDTQDASCWNLWLTRRGEPPFFCHYDFGLLREYRERESVQEDSGRDEFDPEGIIEAWSIYGNPLPEEVAAKLTSAAREDLIPVYFRWLADYVAEALARFEIPHNPQEIAAILTGKTVTDAELDSDIGSMPRFLVSLGFGGDFEEWLAQQLKADEEDYDEEGSAEQPIEQFNFERVAENEVVPLPGGPVPVHLANIHDLFRIAWFCDDDVECGFEIVFPPVARLGDVFSDVEWLHREWEGNTLRLSLPEPGILLTSSGEMLRSRFAQLPEGTRLEMATWGESIPGGRHRYAGEIREGRWHIARSFPQVTHERLEEVVDLCRKIRSDDPLLAENERELADVLETSQKDLMFQQAPLSNDGLRFLLEDWQREYLVKHLFRLRFADVWETAAAARLEAAEFDDFERTLEEATSWIPKIPTTERLVYEGKFARFYEVDTSSLEEDLRKTYSDIINTDASAVSDRIMETLDEGGKEAERVGFAFLGDMCSPKRLGDVLIRVYKGPQPDVFAAHFVGLLGDHSFDFYTRFEDGASLTTTTLRGMMNDARRKVFYQCPEVEEISHLYQQHRAGLEDHGAAGRVPARMGETLQDLAREIDEFLWRTRRATDSRVDDSALDEDDDAWEEQIESDLEDRISELVPGGLSERATERTTARGSQPVPAGVTKTDGREPVTIPPAGLPGSDPDVTGPGFVFFGGKKGLYAVDSRTGKLQWTFETYGTVTSKPVVARGIVAFGCHGGMLCGVDIMTRQLKWTLQTPNKDWDWHPMRVSDSILCFGSDDLHLHAVDIETGRMRWKFETRGRILSAPEIVGEAVYFGTTAGKIYALELQTGNPIWVFDKGDLRAPHPTVGTGK